MLKLAIIGRDSMKYKQLSFSSQLGLGRMMREAVAETIPDDAICPRVSNPTAAIKAFRKTGMHLAEQEERGYLQPSDLGGIA